MRLARAAAEMLYGVQSMAEDRDMVALFDCEADALSYLAWLQTKTDDTYSMVALT
jgi:hypothetical protein